jgi:flagellar biosynthetic protein FlhB
MADDASRTEPSTSKKQRETRDKGEVARSTEISAGTNLIAGLASTLVLGSYLWVQSRRVFLETFRTLEQAPLTDTGIIAFLQSTGVTTLLTMLPVMGVVVLLTVAVNYMQIGFRIAPAVIQPKFDKINPMNGVKRLFSIQSWAELLKASIKLTIASVLVWGAVSHSLPRLVLLLHSSLAAGLAESAALISAVAWRLCVFFALVGIADYAWQRFQFQKKQRMTKQEVRDEFRQTEGDQTIKSRRRAKHRRLAMTRMAAEVARADVVTTNPTHYAVALRYDQHHMRAPKVVAKGERLWAKLIVRLARKHQIPVIENKPVARALYRYVEVGQEIPPTLYRAVAELLAALYKLKARRRFAS